VEAIEKVIVNSVPLNDGLSHWIGKTVEVINRRNFVTGVLLTLKSEEGLICEILENRVTYVL